MLPLIPSLTSLSLFFIAAVLRLSPSGEAGGFQRLMMPLASWQLPAFLPAAIAVIIAPMLTHSTWATHKGDGGQACILFSREGHLAGLQAMPPNGMPPPVVPSDKLMPFPHRKLDAPTLGADVTAGGLEVVSQGRKAQEVQVGPKPCTWSAQESGNFGG